MGGWAADSRATTHLPRGGGAAGGRWGDGWREGLGRVGVGSMWIRGRGGSPRGWVASAPWAVPGWTQLFRGSRVGGSGAAALRMAM